jgi:hypothetical protein
MTPARALLLATGALALAAVCALLAVDVLHRDSSLSAGDVRYAAGPSQQDLWDASEIIPFGSARALLGVDDDLDYRRAVRLFRLSQPRTSPFARIGLAPARAEAEAALTTAAASEDDSTRKSQFLNLVGVLEVIRAAEDALGNPLAMRESVSTFRRALQTNPSNDEAKANLELVLRVRRQQQRTRGQLGSRPQRSARRAGLANGGRGY